MATTALEVQEKAYPKVFTFLFYFERLSMAACQSVKEWLLPAKPLLIVRYLGTTPDSSSLAPLLTSICQQVFEFE